MRSSVRVERAVLYELRVEWEWDVEASEHEEETAGELRLSGVSEAMVENLLVGVQPGAVLRAC